VKVDYLIVGQGIAGSLLAYELIREGQRVLVFEEEKENTSSNKAAGIYNPITGRKMVKTWLADELFPNLENYYLQLENELSSKFLYPKPIYRPFFDFEEQNDWSVKATDPAYSSFVKEIKSSSIGLEGVIDTLGGIMLKQSGYVNIPVMLKALKNLFKSRGLYRAELFSYQDVKKLENGVEYKGVKASKVIFCEGPDAIKNPFWKDLPFKLVKGEIMEIDTALDDGMILNRSVFVLPKNDYFHVGSTYDHHQLDYHSTETGIKNLKDRLGKVYFGDYTVVNTTAGVRPATYDRKPFIGFKNQNTTIGVFNGFGTKGVSLVPYFAKHFVNYLLGKGNIRPEVSVNRVNQ